jgi:hypothetical protein
VSQLFRITLETGDLSEFNSTVGGVSTTTAAAMVGNYGLSCQTSVANNYGVVNFSISSNDMRFRFYINPNTLTMASGDRFNLNRIIHSSGPPFDQVSTDLQFDGANYNIRTLFFDDTGSFFATSFYPISDDIHYIEIWVERASSDVASDGQGHLYIDGDLKETETGIDNFDTFILSAFFRWGAMGVDAGTSGTFFLDDLIFRDDSEEIGAAAIIPIFMSNYRMRRANVS